MPSTFQPPLAPPPATLKTARSQVDSRLNRTTKKKSARSNRPTVNSLLHLYGTWLFDCCLLQINDRHLRSSINDRKSSQSDCQHKKKNRVTPIHSARFSLTHSRLVFLFDTAE